MGRLLTLFSHYLFLRGGLPANPRQGECPFPSPNTTVIGTHRFAALDVA